MAKESLSRRDFMKGAAALGVMAAGSVLGLKSASAETIPAEFVPGTYTATAMGFGGDVTVSITVDETKIFMPFLSAI